MRKNIKQIFFCIIICFSTTAHSQFTEHWSVDYRHTMSANFSNESRKIAVDANGNVFVLADATSNKDSLGVQTTSTFHYVVLQKYTSIGTLSTQVTINIGNHLSSGFENKSAFGLEVDASGNVYIGYVYADPVTKFDVILSKYNNNLVKTWSYHSNGVNNDAGVAFKVLSGTIYAVINSTVGGNSTYSIISASTSGTGNKIYYAFAQNVDVINALTTDGTRNLFVTGYSLVSSYKVVMTAMIYNRAGIGQLGWKVNYNGGSISGDDYGKNLLWSVDGTLYVTGGTYVSSANGTDVFVIRYDSHGVTLWTYFQNQTTSDVGYFVADAEAGNLFVGAVSSTNIYIYHLRSTTGIATLINRVFYFPNPGNPHTTVNSVALNDMKVSVNKSVYITGTVIATDLGGNEFSASYLAKFTVSLISMIFERAQPVEGEFTQCLSAVSMALDNTKTDILWLRSGWINNLNHADEFVNVVDLEGGLALRLGAAENSNSQIENTLTIYPNPASDKVKISSLEALNRIEVYDLTGRQMFFSHLESNETMIDVSDFTNGIYYFRIYYASGDIENRKLIRQ